MDDKMYPIYQVKYITESMQFKCEGCRVEHFILSFFLLQQRYVTATKKPKCISNCSYSLSWHI